MRMRGLLASPDGRRAARGEGVGRTPAEAAATCAEAMRRDGAAGVLETFER
jgi:GTP cyclohydrolase III